MSSFGDRGDDTDARPGGESTTRRPRWVRVAAIIVIVLIVLFVISHLTGGGLREHTPR